MTATPRFAVVEGGRKPLNTAQSDALQQVAGRIRALSDQEAQNLVRLIEALDEADALENLRAGDVPAIQILAEVLLGWDPEGVREFARAWTSTLVAREDGFDWDRSGPEERSEHWRRVQDELWRRGVRG